MAFISMVEKMRKMYVQDNILECIATPMISLGSVGGALTACTTGSVVPPCIFVTTTDCQCTPRYRLLILKKTGSLVQPAFQIYQSKI